MKWLMLTAIALAAVFVTAKVARQRWYSPPTQEYSTLLEATQHGLVARSWLPAPLPATTRSLKLKLYLDSNIMIGRFNYNPAENMSQILDQWERLERREDIDFPPLSKAEPWFPKFLLRRHALSKELPPSWEFRRLSTPNKSGRYHTIDEWYLVSDPSTGISFIWSSEKLDPRHSLPETGAQSR
jgi:hypothetical protein